MIYCCRGYNSAKEKAFRVAYSQLDVLRAVVPHARMLALTATVTRYAECDEIFEFIKALHIPCISSSPEYQVGMNRYNHYYILYGVITVM